MADDLLAYSKDEMAGRKVLSVSRVTPPMANKAIMI